MRRLVVLSPLLVLWQTAAKCGIDCSKFLAEDTCPLDTCNFAFEECSNKPRPNCVPTDPEHAPLGCDYLCATCTNRRVGGVDVCESFSAEPDCIAPCEWTSKDDPHEAEEAVEDSHSRRRDLTDDSSFAPTSPPKETGGDPAAASFYDMYAEERLVLQQQQPTAAPTAAPTPAPTAVGPTSRRKLWRELEDAEEGVDREGGMPCHPELRACCVQDTANVGDGYCDHTGGYNTPECDWDGQDCCEETCVSAEYECGGYDGYQCLDPVFSSQNKHKGSDKAAGEGKGDAP